MNMEGVYEGDIQEERTCDIHLRSMVLHAGRWQCSLCNQDEDRNEAVKTASRDQRTPAHAGEKVTGGTFRERLTRQAHRAFGEGSSEADMILMEGDKDRPRDEEPLHRAAHVKGKKFR